MDGPHDSPRRYVTPEEFARTTGLSLSTVRHYYHLHDEEAKRQMGKLNFIGRSDAPEGSD